MAPVIPVHNWRKGSQVTVQYSGLVSSEVQCQTKDRVMMKFMFCHLAVGCSDQKACRDCCEWHHCVSNVSTTLQG